MGCTLWTSFFSLAVPWTINKYEMNPVRIPPKIQMCV